MIRGREIWREAWRDYKTGAGAVLLVAVVFLVTVGLAATSVSSFGSWVSREGIHFREAGASTYVLRADGQVDPSRCDSLSGVGTIQAAGAMRVVSDTFFAAMPSRAVTTLEATPGLWNVLAASAPGARSNNTAGMWITDTLAETLGVEPGEILDLKDGRKVALAGVFSCPDDGRNRDLGYAVVAPVPARGDFGQCLIEVWPSEPTDASLVLEGLKPGLGSSTGMEIPAPMQLNSSLGKTFTAGNAWSGVVRVGILGAALTGFTVGFAWIFARRLVLSSNLHSGVDRLSLQLIVLAEASFVVLFAVVIWAPIGWFAGFFGGAPDGWVSFFAGLRVLLSGTAGLIVGVVVGFGMVRESRLFRYFKNR